MSKTWESPHDPNEKKDFGLDWSLLLEDAETISTSNWTIVLGVGLVIDSQSNDTTTTTVWVTGGTAGITYQLLNRVVTSAAREYDQTMKLRCRNK